MDKALKRPPIRLSILPFVIAFMGGLLSMAPTNVYKVCRGDVGFLDVTPWLRRRSGALTDVGGRLAGWFARLWASPTARLVCCCAAVMMALMVADLAASHAHHGVLAAMAIPSAAVDSLRRELKEKSAEAVALMARTEGREVSAQERVEIQAALDVAKGLKARIERLEGDDAVRRQIAGLSSGGSDRWYRAGEESEGFSGDGGPGIKGNGFGAQVLRSATFRAMADELQRSGQLSAPFTWPTSEISGAEFLASVSEDSASGGKLVVPDYRPDIVPLVQRRPRMLDILLRGTTASNQVVTMKETAFTNNAAPAAESTALAESDFTFDQVADDVGEVGHWLTVTERLLADAVNAQTYLETRMRMGVDLAFDNQLLNGNGTAPNLRGILNRSGLAAAVARGANTNVDAILNQIAAIESDTDQVCDAVVLHPTNWKTIVQSKDGSGQYYVNGGPFSMPRIPTLWGRLAIVTTAIASGTALVGCFSQHAQVFIRSGVILQSTNAHSDYFTKRLVAVRAMMRAALAVYRPGAFGTVTGLN
jgi:HK97 family phage major capsid protein